MPLADRLLALLLHRVMGLSELVLLRDSFSDCELAALRLVWLVLVLLKDWPRNSVRSLDCGLGPPALDCGLGASRLLGALEVLGDMEEERTDSVDRKREMFLSWAFLRIIARNSSQDSRPSPFWSFRRNTASTCTQNKTWN